LASPPTAGNELLAELSRLGVSASAEGDRLVLRGPQGAITPALRERLARSKPELLERLRLAGGASRFVIPRVPRDGPLPLSFAQQRLFFLDRLGSGTGYNVTNAYRLRGRLDAGALGAALDEVVRRHEALRTTFAEAEGAGIQRIEAPRPVALPFHDLRGSRDPEAEVRQLAEKSLAEPYDLSRGPVIRALLVRIGEEEHVLVLGAHHISYDGWSSGVLEGELAALYRAFEAGQPSPLPEIEVQYADFACWQKERLSGDRLQRELTWWKERLGKAPPRLELPPDRPRRAEPGHRGGRQLLYVPPEVAGDLRALARRQGATLFSTLLAGFTTLLRRYTGQDDLCVGVPTAGRPSAELEKLIGCFSNSLILRIDASGDPSFAELVRRVNDTVKSALEHDELPFERLVEELNPARDLSGNPLFQVAFALQNTSKRAPTAPGLAIEPFDVDVRLTRLDLELHIFDGEAALPGLIAYSTDLFDGETIQRLAVHYMTLLAGAAAAPEERLSRLPILVDAERQYVLDAGRPAPRAYPRDRSLGGLFAEQALRRGDAVAVSYGDERVGYRELDERSNRLARVLSRRGVRPGDAVGLSVEPSVAMVVAMVAIVKAGGAYVPLDPGFPAERLRLMAEDAGLRLVVGRSASPTTEAFGVAVVDLDRDRREIEAEEASPLPDGAGPDALAYVIYTSGSTGIPKGVGVPHRAVVRLVRDTDYVRLTESDVVAQASNATFDAATFEIWGALLNGARLEGLGREVTLSPSALGSALVERGVSVLFLTTALFDQVVKHEPRAFATLRVLLFGGEAVDPRSVREVLRVDPPAELLHVYGPTENTTFST
jgi:non-ribosomal peptide synthetase component F